MRSHQPPRACPDAEVVFARGRMESPGPGAVGNAFISAVRSKFRQVRQQLRGELPRRHSDRSGRQRHQPARPEHDQQLPEHPHRVGRLLAGRGGHRRGARGPDADVGLHQPPAAGRRSAHRRGRAVRQRNSVGRPHHEFQPRLQRPNHRLVSRRRPDLQPGRPAHLGGELAGAPSQRVHLLGHGQPGGRLRRREAASRRPNSGPGAAVTQP